MNVIFENRMINGTVRQIFVIRPDIIEMFAILLLSTDCIIVCMFKNNE